MDKIIEVFYTVVYDSETANYYWHSYGSECCLKWGFWTVVICAFLIAGFFYFFWSNRKVQDHASLRSWIYVGLIGMLITFVAGELVIGARCQLEGLDAYVGESSADIIVFNLYNGIVGFAFFYLVFSTIMQLFSRNAKNIPWHFYKVSSQG